MITNILEYLENSVRLTPDKKAFEDDSKYCTYMQLQDQAKVVGSVLAKKVPTQTPIPVFMNKNVSTIIAFMGAVYAGCFYVMLDVMQPISRLNQICNILEPKVIIVDHENASKLESLEFTGEVLYIEELIQGQMDEKLLMNRRVQALDRDPLYGIFTSGSTGIPKCTVVSHKSVIDFMEHFTTIFHITKDDIIGNQAPFDFDVSVKDIYSTLKMGATMAIIPRQMFSFPTQLLDYLSDRKVSTLIWAVSALCIITTLNGFEYKIPPYINKILFSGEVMPIKHLNRWRQTYPRALFVNLYGPTEITCNCTYYILEREFNLDEVLPIGHAFPNEKVFLLDENNQLITQKYQKGELCVSGTALSLGYYNDMEQTQKVFVQNPLNPFFLELIYRTGDLAYYNGLDELCFASRIDTQIKHMGHRIELGEIEKNIDVLPAIIRSCCIFDEVKNRIVAFYEGEMEKGQIVKHLKTRLPNYMLPNAYKQVASMPITKNGKIDRKSLKSLM